VLLALFHLMDGDLPRDTMSIVQKARLNSTTLEKRNFGTHMRAVIVLSLPRTLNKLL
jgi:hypothetical protein